MRRLVVTRRFAVAVVSILALAGAIRNAAAEDTLKVAIPQKGAWDAGIAELGQRGGFFKKHGLNLDILYTTAGPESIQAMIAAPDPRQALALYARLGREIAQRTHRLVTVILAQAATGDAALTEFAAQIEAQRAIGTAATARHLASRFGLRTGLTEQAAADILWTLTAPDIVERLITQRNWPWDTYERWLADAMASSLLPPGPQAALRP